MSKKPTGHIIWIAEDNHDLGEIFEYNMKKRGHTARYFSEPDKLIKALKLVPPNERPDVIVTDNAFSPAVRPMVAMRGDDKYKDSPEGGIEIINAVNALHLAIPVILFTGREERHFRDVIRHSRVSVTVIEKPSTDKLYKAINDKLEQGPRR